MEEKVLEGNSNIIEVLRGRNYYHYINGILDPNQDNSCFLKDNQISCGYGKLAARDYSKYMSEDCWAKKMLIYRMDTQYYAVFCVDIEDNEIKCTYAFGESPVVFCGGMFYVPGIDELEEYESFELDGLPAECEAEEEKLRAGIHLKKGFSFIGKKLSGYYIELSDEDYNSCNISVDSAYRNAVVNLIPYTDENFRIKEFDVETYHSFGDFYADMFSRPQIMSNVNEEIIDALLDLYESYDEGELEE